MTKQNDIKTRILMLQLLTRDFIKTADTLGERGDGKHSQVFFNWDFEKVFRNLNK